MKPKYYNILITFLLVCILGPLTLLLCLNIYTYLQNNNETVNITYNTSYNVSDNITYNTSYNETINLKYMDINDLLENEFPRIYDMILNN